MWYTKGNEFKMRTLNLINMKKKTLLILSLFLFVTGIFAQSPGKITYQAVVRDADGDLVKNTTVGIQLSILQTTIDGTSVYVENHASETNINGLVTCEIGNGTSLDAFDLIDWANGPYFLKTEIDVDGGTNYSITSTSQLLSVPFALYANTADTLIGTISEEQIVDFDTYLLAEVDGDSINEIQQLSLEADTLTLSDGGSVVLPFPDYHVGDLYAGGVIFYVEGNGEHGLVVSATDISTSAVYGQNFVTTGASSSWNGQANSDLLSVGASVGDAVELVSVLSLDGFDDWYLPSVDELSLIYANRYVISKVLSSVSGADLMVGHYWSSTEYDSQNAYYISFHIGDVSSNGGKSLSKYVRAIRAF